MIYILTPCSRIENIKLIEKSIFETNNKVQWCVCVDTKHITEKFIDTDNIKYFYHKNDKSNYGNSQRNYLLDNIIFNDDDYIYFLDDDNIIHENFYKEIFEYLGIYDIIIFDQVFKNNTIRFLGQFKLPRAGCIDTAQVIFNKKALNKCRFLPIYEYLTDYNFYNHMFSSSNLKVKVLRKNLCYYNYLK